jgi:methylenetetrahydrofolate reductase (NADPH)
MRITDLVERGGPVFSFEFFPPRTTAGSQALVRTIGELHRLHPDFVSVTYPLEPSRRHLTLELVSKIKYEVGIESMAHLTCVGSTREHLSEELESLEQAGIENVLLLRGDRPSGEDEGREPEQDFAHASDLAAFVRGRFAFCIGGAAYPEKHPEAPDFETDLENTLTKVRAGCEFLITQLFFDNDDYFGFVKRARATGIGVPILPGIMPITNVQGIKRMTQLCGATIPPDLLAELERSGDDEQAVARIGIAHAQAQCQALLDGGAPGIHFYTLNRSTATREILSDLRQAPSVA